MVFASILHSGFVPCCVFVCVYVGNHVNVVIVVIAIKGIGRGFPGVSVNPNSIC